MANFEYKFQVIGGSYRTKDGRTFKRGDVFNTTTPLHKQFPNGFKVLCTLPDPDSVSLPEFSCALSPRKLRGSKALVVNTQTKRVLSATPMEMPSVQAVVEHDFSKHWAAQPLFDGATVFILGGGPSLKDMDLSAIQEDYKVIGVNDSYLLGEWVDICFFGDFHWLVAHKEELAKWPGMKITNAPNVLGTKGIFVMERLTKQFGRPDQLSWWKNSGATSIVLAGMLGAEKVVLLGFDCKLGKVGESNWHSNNLNVNTARTYKEFDYMFQLLATVLPKQFPNMKVVNATPDSALDVFPKATLEEVLRGDASKS